MTFGSATSMSLNLPHTASGKDHTMNAYGKADFIVGLQSNLVCSGFALASVTYSKNIKVYGEGIMTRIEYDIKIQIFGQRDITS